MLALYNQRPIISHPFSNATWNRMRLGMLPLSSTPPPTEPKFGHGVDCPVLDSTADLCIPSFARIDSLCAIDSESFPWLAVLGSGAWDDPHGVASAVAPSDQDKASQDGGGDLDDDADAEGEIDDGTEEYETFRLSFTAPAKGKQGPDDSASDYYERSASRARSSPFDPPSSSSDDSSSLSGLDSGSACSQGSHSDAGVHVPDEVDIPAYKVVDHISGAPDEYVPREVHTRIPEEVDDYTPELDEAGSGDEYRPRTTRQRRGCTKPRGRKRRRHNTTSSYGLKRARSLSPATTSASTSANSNSGTTSNKRRRTGQITPAEAAARLRVLYRLAQEGYARWKLVPNYPIIEESSVKDSESEPKKPALHICLLELPEDHPTIIKRREADKNNTDLRCLANIRDSTSGWTKHALTHVGEYNESFCMACGKEFTRVSSVQRHMHSCLNSKVHKRRLKAAGLEEKPDGGFNLASQTLTQEAVNRAAQVLEAMED
ncbi:uncharacterized protein SCHCODRAFT_02603446 [Schizophyllum commune H4-8]|uniref:C2H2-type domain-containing protein n=1 Tax=Schizophyllum commune (strain H4-8 / FGSC 9210) TaxID=578458 RepID=D8QK01_SCHCM|nr:uncharacterized protein SCHCODRAFT_02603446 [Schizophyllum commune H4-8]KAI5885639.1 hypothetical protein SCHCODRAFT_02603446 [Schizophyllum commune H4-8]